METEQTKGMVISGYAFHCHHDILVEFVTDYEARVDYIKREKPPDEQELRLKLFKVIPVDRLPYELLQAEVKWDEARVKLDEARVKLGEAEVKLDEAEVKWDEARVKRDEAWVKLGEARVKRDEAWVKRDEAEVKRDEAEVKLRPYFTQLHTELCPNCPWDGKTIFTKGVN